MPRTDTSSKNPKTPTVGLRVRIFFHIAACLSIVLSSFLFLGADWGRSWESVRKSASRIRSVKADFVQEKSMKILARPLVSKGRFSFIAPDTIRWEYTSPIRTLVEMQKGAIRRYVVRNGKLVRDRSFTAEALHNVLGEVSNWIRGRFQTSRSFKAVLRPGDPTAILLEPKKKVLSRFIKSIVVTLDKSPGVISSIRIDEAGDASTMIRFLRPKIEHR